MHFHIFKNTDGFNTKIMKKEDIYDNEVSISASEHYKKYYKIQGKNDLFFKTILKLFLKFYQIFDLNFILFFIFIFFLFV